MFLEFEPYLLAEFFEIVRCFFIFEMGGWSKDLTPPDRLYKTSRSCPVVSVLVRFLLLTHITISTKRYIR